MNAAASLVLLLAATTQAKDDSASQQAARGKHERVLAIYTNDAAEFTIYRDASRKERVELRREPVLVCSDPAREGGDGAVFVWTCRGRAEVIGSFFSFPTTGPRSSSTSFIRCHSRCWTYRARVRMLRPGRPWHRASRWRRSRARLVPPNPPRSGCPRCAR